MDDPGFPDPSKISWNTAYADCIISATKQQVWKVLTNFADYDAWNSFTYDVEMPTFEVGYEFTFTVNMARYYRRKQRERIVHIEPNEVIAWGFPYDQNPFLNATRYQVITSTEAGSTFYRTWETFTGILTPLLRVTVFGMVQRGFDRCASDLKAHCERLF